jgi:hypothetical protein
MLRTERPRIKRTPRPPRPGYVRRSVAVAEDECVLCQKKLSPRRLRTCAARGDSPCCGTCRREFLLSECRREAELDDSYAQERVKEERRRDAATAAMLERRIQEAYEREQAAIQ